MLELLDYRRRINQLYDDVRRSDDPASAWQTFRDTRDQIFRTHPQSPLDAADQAAFTGLPYYDYDPAYRVLVTVNTRVEPKVIHYALGDDGAMRCTRFAQVHFKLPTGLGVLNLFWINGYGGGVFLPFGDATNRHTTYGGGRYLYDTIKGADLGSIEDKLILDFNFAYHPSCAYNPRWVCPLTPRDNVLSIPIPAGERVEQ